jgi:sulfur dioxygenase
MIRTALLWIAVIFCAGCSHSLTGAKPPFQEMAVAALHAKLEASETLVLLDVRTREEFDGPLGHLQGAVLIPVQELPERIKELAPYKKKAIVVICRGGNRSRKAAQILADQGFRKVFNMTGGMMKWNEAFSPKP